jgi:CO/xanthine dehydrogenase Mo-binding subunit
MSSGGTLSPRVEVDAQGRVLVRTGKVELGQGIVTALAQIAAEELDVPLARVTMISGARILAGSGWLGLKDREAYVTRGVKLTPMFTGLLALAALLFFITLAWWREGK